MQFINKVFMRELNPLLNKGSKQPLKQEDVGKLDEHEQCKIASDVFADHWAREKASSVLSGKPPSLWKAIFRTIGYKQQIFGICLNAIAAGGSFGPPLILKAFGDNFSGQAPLSDKTLWILVGLLFVIPTISSVASAQSFAIYSHTATVVRSAIIPAVFNKSLMVGPQAKLTYNTGTITNLFSNDITQMYNFFQGFADTLFSPFQLAAALGLVYNEVGLAMFAACGFIVCLLPVMIVSNLI